MCFVCRGVGLAVVFAPGFAEDGGEFLDAGAVAGVGAESFAVAAPGDDGGDAGGEGDQV